MAKLNMDRVVNQALRSVSNQDLDEMSVDDICCLVDEISTKLHDKKDQRIKRQTAAALSKEKLKDLRLETIAAFGNWLDALIDSNESLNDIYDEDTIASLKTKQKAEMTKWMAKIENNLEHTTFKTGPVPYGFFSTIGDLLF